MKHARARFALASAALCLALACALIGDTALAASSDTTWTLAGTGEAVDSGDGGQAREAAINQPRSVFPSASGGYVWAEPWSNKVRAVGNDGIMVTLAGTGAAGFTGDGGSATAATLNFVHAAAPTPDGGYLLADTLNNRIRKISAGGVVTTVAGNGSAGYSGDGGPATAAQINNPRGVVALADGGFLIPDSNNHRVRKVSAAGTITTAAGTGTQGFAGDGGPATSAQLSIPFGVAPTADGGFLIVDVGNQRIRKVSGAGTITTVAGNGVAGYSGDGGPATSASLRDPHNVVSLSDGGFLIADASNQRVRQVAANGIISTLIGDGTRGYTGDGGPAAAAQVSVPKAVAVTPAGDVLIADEQNSRIRFVGTVVVPANTAAPVVSGNPVQGLTLTATAGGWSGTGPVPAYQWQRCNPTCANLAGAVANTYTPVAADVGATLRIGVTSSNPAGSTTAYSSETAAVTASATPPVNLQLPVITGVARFGETLTASDGTWSGTTPFTFSYRWRRCNAAGAACVDISGANAKTYVVTAPDVDSTLRVAVTAANGSSVYATAVSSDGPRSYWRFNDATGALVDQMGTANGTYVGLPQTGVTGLLTGDPDTGVSFNGTSQYADVPAAAAWTPPAFSIELSVRPSELPVNKTIWSTQGAFTGWWLNTGPSGEVRLFVGDGSGWRFDDSGPVLNAGSTYHLVATYDGTNARLYVNGALVSTGPNVTMAAAAANVMRFGAYSTGPGQYWPGVVDEASFFPVALSSSRLQAHYSASVTGSQATSAATGVVTTAAPVNTLVPVVSGVAQVGQTLSASTGSWSGTSPISYASRWQRCSPGCLDISGASGSSYTVVAADVGATLRAVVTASNSAGSSEAASAQTAPVIAAGAVTVTFSGTAGGDDGDVNVASNQPAGYPPSGTPAVNTTNNIFTAGRRLAFGRYQIMQALLRFDTSSLPDNATVTSAKLRLSVTAKTDGDNRSLVGEWYDSSNWPIDEADWSVNTGTTAIAGADLTALAVNTTIELPLTTPTNTSLAGYTAFRLGISGGIPTADNYLQLATLEHTTRTEPQLVITYTVGSGEPTPPSNTLVPVVSGVAQVGQTLSASTGSWSGTSPISYASRWQRCSPGCLDISGASGSSYTVVAADVGATLRAVVTASNSAGSSEAASAQTAPVIAAGAVTVTFSGTAGGDDGDVNVASNQPAGYPPSGTPAVNTTNNIFTAGRRLAFGRYQIMQALLRFDTSSLPDNATVTSAKLRLSVTAKTDGDNRSLVGEWYDSSNWPIDEADWSVNTGTTAIAGADLTALAVNTTIELPLTTPTNTSLAGYTAFRLGISGGIPTADNYLQLATLEHTTRTEPQLVITYTTP